MMKDERKHVVILGGGVGGCVTAFWLSSTSELRRRYRVTLYQMGWRLGGKGASSRNADKQYRSEEHGPHVWFGFYENAFRTLRHCMEEHKALKLSIGDRVDLDDLFEASREGVFYDRSEGGMEPWRLELPTYDREGKPGDQNPQPEVRESLWRMADHLGKNLKESGILGGLRGRVLAAAGHVMQENLPVEEPDNAVHGTNPEDPTAYASYLSRRLVELADSEKVWYGEWVVGRLLKWFLDYVGWEIRRKTRKPDLSTEERRALCLADLYRTCLRGGLVDILIKDRHFEDLDREEFMAWLKRHGAAYTKLKESPFLRGYYDTPFAYLEGRDGGEVWANFAAGAALRGFFRVFFGYKGSYLYKMRLGMGECVFVPLFRVLKSRGVEFRFFHKVTDLVPNELGNRIERVEFRRQAELAEGVDEYHPLEDAPSQDGSHTWPVWPDRPIRRFLDESSLPSDGDPGLESAWSNHKGRKFTLHDRTIDAENGFDHLVLAIPPGAHRHIAGKLMDGYARFGEMVESSRTVRTMAFQLWVSGAEDGLGWQKGGNFTEPALAAALPRPVNVLLEASDIKVTEMTEGVNHLMYFCCPSEDDEDEPAPGTDADYPAAQAALAKKECMEGLRKWSAVWPGICGRDGFLDPSQLHHPDPEASDEERLEWQYFRINIDPSERYVLSTNTSTPNRLEPWDTGYNNLVFAGDWCRNRIDIGCVESAATSGMLASHVICGHPDIREIAGRQYR